jgi:hypothetical protein
LNSWGIDATMPVLPKFPTRRFDTYFEKPRFARLSKDGQA